MITVVSSVICLFVGQFLFCFGSLGVPGFGLFRL